MPICFYCLKEKAPAEFTNEHVLTRAFCGQGNNWTLKEMVCSDCNGELSKFESHWASNAMEALMRVYSGPLGRPSKSATRRHPLEVDELYLVQGDDPLVYEAGMAFPADTYFRPQILSSPQGLVCIAANASDGQALEKAMAIVRKPPFEISVPNLNSRGYEIATIGLNPKGQFRIQSTRSASQPSGIWLRTMSPNETFQIPNGKKFPITARLALDDRGRLYMRATDVASAASFFDEFRKPPAPRAPPRTYLPEEQIVRPQINIKLPTVFRAVLKTGLNLVAHIAGSSVAANNAFDELRSELFDLESDDAIMRRCRFLGARPRWLSWLPSDFPPPANELQHRLMLDVAGGKIRFRTRLYGHLGYKGWLGPATQSIVAKIPTSRVIVNFDTTGIELVDTWPTDKT